LWRSLLWLGILRIDRLLLSATGGLIHDLFGYGAIGLILLRSISLTHVLPTLDFRHDQKLRNLT
jgi:hypothetical protein